MLNSRTISSEGREYAEKYLAHSDYYDESKKSPGTWHCAGAELLGLEGEVKNDDFKSLMDGVHPRTGELLRIRKVGDKKDSKGNVVSHKLSAIDATITAPKGFSILLSKDDRLKEAWETAMVKTIAHMENRLMVRDFRDGKTVARNCKPVIARYDHNVSRALDYNQHSHLVVFNAAFDDVSKKWRTIDTKPLFARKAVITEIFRAELGREVLSLGYDLRQHRDERGKHLGWEIEGVTPEIRDKCSERSAQKKVGIEKELKRRQALLREHSESKSAQNIEAWLAERGEIWGNTDGQTLSDVEVAQIVRDTRASKPKKLSEANVKKIADGKLTQEEHDHLEGIVAAAKTRDGSGVKGASTGTREAGKFVSADQAVGWAIDHLMERKSVISDGEVLVAAAQQFQGLDVDAAMGTLVKLKKSGEILLNRDESTGTFELTTADEIEREAKYLALVKSGMGQHGPLAKEDFEPVLPPDPEDKYNEMATRRVIKNLLHSKDFCTLFIGAAGTGKTTAAKEVARAIRENGAEVFALAPTVSAVNELKKEGFPETQTIALALKKNALSPQAKPGDVLLVDEAGMIGSKSMLGILELAYKNQMRVVLQGDAKQIRSVDSGDSMSIILENTDIHRSTLSRVQRQRQNKEYKKAVEKLRTNPEKGLDDFIAMGAVEQVGPDEMADRIAEEYFAASGKIGPNGQPETVTIVAATHATIKRITEQIRAAKMVRGEIDSRNQVHRKIIMTAGMTDAQKRNLSSYKKGQIISFQDNYDKKFQKHTRAEVMGVDQEKGELIIKNKKSGEQMAIAPRNISKVVDVGFEQAIDVAPGDKLMFKANRHFKADDSDSAKRRCVNGEVVEVLAVNQESGDIRLKDGRIIRKDFQEFGHAYAVTAHKSQGQTLDAVIVAADGMDAEGAYVAMSRGRKNIKIFTRNVADLQASISVSGARKSATEFASHYSDYTTTFGDARVADYVAQKDSERVLTRAEEEVARINRILGRSAAKLGITENRHGKAVS